MDSLDQYSLEVFAPHPESQDAVFSISYGWTGGMGEAVLDPETQRPRRVDDLPVFINGESLERIMNKVISPSSWMGRPIIKVSARIHLESKRERNYSIPEAPFRSYWSLQVEILREVFAHFESE